MAKVESAVPAEALVRMYLANVTERAALREQVARQIEHLFREIGTLTALIREIDGRPPVVALRPGKDA